MRGHGRVVPMDRPIGLRARLAEQARSTCRGQRRPALASIDLSDLADTEIGRVDLTLDASVDVTWRGVDDRLRAAITQGHPPLHQHVQLFNYPQLPKPLH